MKYDLKEGNIILFPGKEFDISQTLECGQCFRFQLLPSGIYEVYSGNRVLQVKQEKDKIIFYHITMESFLEYWKKYFDLDTNYEHIKQILSEKDPILKSAVEYAPGIRLLNQDFFECLISFIISQNKTIPMIKQIIKNLCQTYGPVLSEGRFGFPKISALSAVSEEKYRELKAGFRAKYIVDAVKKLSEGEIEEKSFSILETKELRDTLMTIYGVGPKVADCTMLFSCGRREVFPTDVWVKRVMTHFYFPGNDPSMKEIQEFAKDKFGEFAGFAQQYLFYYAREEKIGK